MVTGGSKYCLSVSSSLFLVLRGEGTRSKKPRAASSKIGRGGMVTGSEATRFGVLSLGF